MNLIKQGLQEAIAHAKGDERSVRVHHPLGIDVEKVAAAIEADAGQVLPGLPESLAEAKAGKFAQKHAPEQIARRRASGTPQNRVPKRVPNAKPQ